MILFYPLTCRLTGLVPFGVLPAVEGLFHSLGGHVQVLQFGPHSLINSLLFPVSRTGAPLVVSAFPGKHILLP